MDAGSLGPDVPAKVRTKLSDLLSQCTAELTKKPAAQLSITPDDQSDSDEANNMTGDNQIWHSEQNDTPNSHALTSSTVTKEKSSVTNIGACGHKVEDNSIKKVDFVMFVDGCQWFFMLVLFRKFLWCIFMFYFLIFSLEFSFVPFRMELVNRALSFVSNSAIMTFR